MKSFVRVTIPANESGRGSVREYIVDGERRDHGADVAALITETVDTRPDPEGRLAELRRHLGELAGIRRRAHRKPGRVRYDAISRMTGKAVAVELRHHDTPASVAPNTDEPVER